MPLSLWLAMDWYTLPIAPFTDWPVVLVCVASRSEPLSGDEVTPCSLPVDPLNDAAGVGRFFLSLIQTQVKIDKNRRDTYELRYSAIFSARSRYCLHLASIFSFTFSLSVSSGREFSQDLNIDKKLTID